MIDTSTDDGHISKPEESPITFVVQRFIVYRNSNGAML